MSSVPAEPTPPVIQDPPSSPSLFLQLSWLLRTQRARSFHLSVMGILASFFIVPVLLVGLHEGCLDLLTWAFQAKDSISAFPGQWPTGEPGIRLNQALSFTLFWLFLFFCLFWMVQEWGRKKELSLLQEFPMEPRRFLYAEWLLSPLRNRSLLLFVFFFLTFFFSIGHSFLPAFCFAGFSTLLLWYLGASLGQFFFFGVQRLFRQGGGDRFFGGLASSLPLIIWGLFFLNFSAFPKIRDWIALLPSWVFALPTSLPVHWVGSDLLPGFYWSVFSGLSLLFLGPLLTATLFGDRLQAIVGGSLHAGRPTGARTRDQGTGMLSGGWKPSFLRRPFVGRGLWALEALREFSGSGFLLTKLIVPIVFVSIMALFAFPGVVEGRVLHLIQAILPTLVLWVFMDPTFLAIQKGSWFFQSLPRKPLSLFVPLGFFWGFLLPLYILLFDLVLAILFHGWGLSVKELLLQLAFGSANGWVLGAFKAENYSTPWAEKDLSKAFPRNRFTLFSIFLFLSLVGFEVSISHPGAMDGITFFLLTFLFPLVFWKVFANRYSYLSDPVYKTSTQRSSMGPSPLPLMVGLYGLYLIILFGLGPRGNSPVGWPKEMAPFLKFFGGFSVIGGGGFLFLAFMIAHFKDLLRSRDLFTLSGLQEGFEGGRPGEASPLLGGGLGVLAGLLGGGFLLIFPAVRGALRSRLLGGSPLLLVLFLLLFPLVQELLFRGFLYAWLRFYFRSRSALWISALFFGLMLPFPLAVPALLLGLAAGWSYERSGRLSAALLCNYLALGIFLLSSLV